MEGASPVCMINNSVLDHAALHSSTQDITEQHAALHYYYTDYTALHYTAVHYTALHYTDYTATSRCAALHHWRWWRRRSAVAVAVATQAAVLVTAAVAVAVIRCGDASGGDRYQRFCAFCVPLSTPFFACGGLK